MPCPNCGGGLSMVNPSVSTSKDRDYDYESAVCVGKVKKQGYRRMKVQEGEKYPVSRYCIVYHKDGEPCGWSFGRKKEIESPLKISEDISLTATGGSTPTPLKKSLTLSNSRVS